MRFLCEFYVLVSLALLSRAEEVSLLHHRVDHCSWGQSAVSNCSQNASGYYCESPGYHCDPNAGIGGRCCLAEISPRCSDGTVAAGSCSAGECPIGFTCGQPNNLCCHTDQAVSNASRKESRQHRPGKKSKGKCNNDRRKGCSSCNEKTKQSSDRNANTGGRKGTGCEGRNGPGPDPEYEAITLECPGNATVGGTCNGKRSCKRGYDCFDGVCCRLKDMRCTDHSKIPVGRCVRGGCPHRTPALQCEQPLDICCQASRSSKVALCSDGSFPTAMCDVTGTCDFLGFASFVCEKPEYVCCYKPTASQWLVVLPGLIPGLTPAPIADSWTKSESIFESTFATTRVPPEPILDSEPGPKAGPDPNLLPTPTLVHVRQTTVAPASRRLILLTESFTGTSTSALTTKATPTPPQSPSTRLTIKPQPKIAPTTTPHSQPFTSRPMSQPPQPAPTVITGSRPSSLAPRPNTKSQPKLASQTPNPVTTPKQPSSTKPITTPTAPSFSTSSGPSRHTRPPGATTTSPGTSTSRPRSLSQRRHPHQTQDQIVHYPADT